MQELFEMAAIRKEEGIERDEREKPENAKKKGKKIEINE